MCRNSSGFFNISLEKLTFYGKIGVFEQERTVGNEFLIDCKVKVSTEDFEPENLDSSISYASIFEEIAAIMSQDWKLLESVAMAIARKLLSRWPQILNVSVKITKVAPPISGIQGQCSVEYVI
ncbi:MAG: dihydroneopterin aldolase [Bacteroidales bacterium]|nr:dihydroneopterin aldolase [Bacteroidales bacterium]